MASYFVIAPDGAKYGPADEALLQQWVQEGRLNAETILENAATAERTPASAVTGLSFTPAAPAAQSPFIETPVPPATPFQQQPAPFQPGGSPYGQQPGQWGAPPSNYYRAPVQGVVFDANKSDRSNGLWLIILGSIAAAAGLFIIGMSFLVTLAPGERRPLMTPYPHLVGLMALLIGGADIAAGIGMRQSRRWAFILVIVTCIVNLVSFLFGSGVCGVILSVYYIAYAAQRLTGKKGTPPT